MRVLSQTESQQTSGGYDPVFIFSLISGANELGYLKTVGYSSLTYGLLGAALGTIGTSALSIVLPFGTGLIGLGAIGGLAVGGAIGAVDSSIAYVTGNLVNAMIAH